MDRQGHRDLFADGLCCHGAGRTLVAPENYADEENMKGDTLKAIVGHVCFYCHHSFDQTKDNPSRTDFCVKCGHRGEGIKRTLEKRDWGILHVRPND